MKIKNYDYMPIGQRIKTARKNKRFTQEYIAERLNVSCQHISDIERGLNGISLSSFMELCKILETSADYLLFGISSNEQPSPIEKMLIKMTPQQAIYAEEILTAYAKSCGIML